MYVGNSSSRGIVIGDTSKPAPNAVYGWRKNGDGEILLEIGSFKELVKRKTEDAEPDGMPDEEKGTVRRVFGVMGVFLTFCAAVWVLFGFVNFLAALVFSVLAYFPVMVIMYARWNPYRTDELHQQFRRYHGCEHACVLLLSEEKSVNMENLMKSPIYDSECGTVYAGYFFTLAVEIGLMLSTLVNIGFMKSLAVLLATVIMLFILIFLPWNPYKRLQYPAVAQPTEREYELGMAVLDKFCSEIIKDEK